jgi:hypothetical protein
MINKVLLIAGGMANENEMYLSGMSIPEVSEATGVAKSTLRFRFKKLGILRSRADGVRMSESRGRNPHKGNSLPRSEKTKEKIKAAKLKLSDETAIGFRFTPSGYMEFTKGPYKGRLVHDVIVEKRIKRRLRKDEIVHHLDGIRSNNHPLNLELKTRSAHARDHAISACRSRNNLGRFA